MSGHSAYTPASGFGRFINSFEENVIALLLGLMTAITFTNVILRYGFGNGLIWGLEVTLILFAWLVMFGISYAVKITAHLGVDAIVNMVGKPVRKVLLVLTMIACLAYALLLMKGAWDFFANFANLPQTTGRWFPTGLQEMKIWDAQGYRPTQQVPIPEFLRTPIEAIFLPEGEDPYEKMPVVIPYLIVPLGVGLFLFRLVQAAVQIARGTRHTLIVSHEAEEAVEEVAALNRED